VSKSTAKPSAPTPPSPKPAASPAPAAAAPKAGAKSSAKSSAAAKAAAKPVPAPAPATSRFAERFAPPRPPARGYPEPVDIVKTAHKADPKLVNAWKTKAGRDLTEAELQAMPESEYMNEKQLEFFRVRLQALKDDLLSNAGETTEHLREDTSIVPDPADRATIEEEHALELRTRDRERKLLKKISQSIVRIDAGDYGFCDETGEPIGLGRLLARPTATLSLEAQQRRELKQKMFGD
jgi:DnaK suppressor protein